MREAQALVDYGVSIVVVGARPQSPLKVGQQFEVRTFPVVIGRALESGVRIADNTVSRAHASVDVIDGRLALSALSSASSVWVDQLPVEAGERVYLEPSETLVQLGGVLLRFDVSESTAPYPEPLAVPASHRPRGLLHISVVSEGLHVHFLGVDVQLHRGPAYVLLALARQPNAVVAEETLLLYGGGVPERALGRNLNQLVTYIRNALKAAISGMPEKRARLIEALDAAERARGDHSALDPEISDDSLMRRLIKNHRRYGYSLRLQADDVSVAETALQERYAEGLGAFEL